MEALTVILAIGTTARLTRLITTDKITEQPRDWILDRINPTGLLTYMLGCPWCVSIYTGLLAATAATYAPHSPWWQLPAVALTASHVTGYIANTTED